MIKFAVDFEINCIMTPKITLSGIVLAMICLCTSCLSSDDEVVTYDDTAVTTFRLGNVRCYRTVKTAAGEDSTYSYTYSASTTPIYIDQVRRRIFNEDSLAVGTDLSRILTTITTKNNGVALFKNIADDNWTLYSSADSIDYSQRRTLRIVSSDGQHEASYTVDIVCHKEYADSFSWSRMPNDAAIATMTRMKAAQAGQWMYLMGADDAGSVSLLRSEDGSGWTACSGMPQVTDMETASMTAIGGTLMIYTDGTIYSTEDGETWTGVTPAEPLKALLGGCGSEIYAIGSDGRIMVSADNGAQWAPDDMESTEYVDNTQYLPATDITLLAEAAKTNAEITRVTMVGNCADDGYGYAVVWNKVVDASAPQPWTFTPQPWNNYYYTMPRMKGLTAIEYADGILAMGGTAPDGSGTAYSKMYYSPDHGVTWHTQTSMNLPQDIQGAQTAVLVNDGKGSFLVIAANPNAANADGRCVIWKGRQNKALWQDTGKYFE